MGRLMETGFIQIQTDDEGKNHARLTDDGQAFHDFIFRVFSDGVRTPEYLESGEILAVVHLMLGKSFEN